MNQIPGILWKFFRWCCPTQRPDLHGDFAELYEDRLEEFSVRKVRWLFFKDCLTLIPLKVITKTKRIKEPKTQGLMLNMYFKVARRNLLKNKLYSFINLLGLSVGLTACTLIALYVQGELSYDKHFKDHNKIYRISGVYDQGGGEKIRSAVTSYLLKPTIRYNFPDAPPMARIDFLNSLVKIDEKFFWEENVVVADSTFFSIFSFDFVLGSPEIALSSPEGVVIDQSTALKYFGTSEAVDQVILMNDHPFKITAVISDIPANTHFHGNIFVPTHGVIDQYPAWVTRNFSGTSHYTYMKVGNDFEVRDFEVSLKDFIDGYYDFGEAPEYFFQPIKEIHLKSDLLGEIESNSSIYTVYIFGATALVILLLAYINYINLTLAGSFERSKEVGIKKVLGASRRSQLFQFQSESILLGFIASILAVLFVELILPYFNAISGKSLQFNLLHDIILGLGMFTLTCIIGMLSGSFPALFLLRLPTSKALANSPQSTKNHKLSARNVLIISQFLLAAILISSTLVVIRQMSFLKNKDLGIDTENLVMIPFQTREISQKYEVMRDEFLRKSSVISVTTSNNKVTSRVSNWRQYSVVGKEDTLDCPTVIVGYDFFKTMKAEIIGGRSFSKDYSTDETEAYIVNESGAKFLGVEDVGDGLYGSAFTGADWSVKKAKVVGIVKDFHFASLHSQVRPTVFSLSSEITTPLNWIKIRISPNDIQGTLEHLENTWASLNPDRPFRYEFMEDALSDHYNSEEQFLQVFSSFSLLSIFIGCLGLFGLTALVMKRRTKEIGIRKVLGASIPGLLKILSKDFLILVLIANSLGWPITIWLMEDWLQNFAYQVPISWWLFALTAVGAILVAFLTIIYHSVKVAIANPVNSLRYE